MMKQAACIVPGYGTETRNPTFLLVRSAYAHAMISSRSQDEQNQYEYEVPVRVPRVIVRAYNRCQYSYL
eukprot:scaffold579_cov37-Prasinocladus_malaysianus.AAC.2